MKLFLLTFLIVVFAVSPTLSLPTSEATTLAWDLYPDQTLIDGFYIYWVPKVATVECKDHTTYTDTNRHQLPDPTAVGVTLSVFLPGKLRVLCFALTVYDAEDNESTFAIKSASGDDFGWTGTIIPTEFAVN